MRTKNVIIVLIIGSTVSNTSTLSLPSLNMNKRRAFVERLTAAVSFMLVSSTQRADALANLATQIASGVQVASTTATIPPSQMAAYKPLSITTELGVDVPVACWFPVEEETGSMPTSSTTTSSLLSEPVTYQHRISVRKIGQLLAGWDFIPNFVSRDFPLSPTLSSSIGVGGVINGANMPLPSKAPVVLLAHGYLGSRFDLSHLAERLASLGFVCLAPEYPESLAASYDCQGLNRAVITSTLLKTLQNDWNIQPSSYGIVGHSLGCGTALETGDENWSRVLIAGFPRFRDGRPVPGNVLLLTSMNDGAVSLSRMGGKASIPSDFALLDPEDVNYEQLPPRAALVLEGDKAPNHISFLSEGVNDAMIDLLSPLLPIAQALNIPVLDFDRYQISRDSLSTAQLVHPIVISYLKNQMNVH